MVRDERVRVDILREVRVAVAGLGLVPAAAVRSPLRGPAGNVEAFFLIRRAGDAPESVDDATLAAAGADIVEPG